MNSVDEPRDGSGEEPPVAPPAGEPADQPVAAPPPVPPPLFPTDRQPIGAADPAAQPGFEPPPPPKKGGRARLGAALVVGAAILGAIAVKFVLPIVLVGVAGGVLGVAFGGPYMQLPGDVRSGFEQRLETALDDSFDDLSEAEQAVRIAQLIDGGMPRLDDGLITANFRLTAKALVAVDDASCGKIARATFAGIEPSDDAANALVGTLEGTELQQWFEVRIAAVEAEVRGSPAQVLITDAAVDPLFQRLFPILSEADTNTLAAISTGGTVDDAALCSAMRGLYNSVLQLSAADALLFARYDATP
jgi:hypothetical protein